MNQISELIESNHMDYSSGRVQFILGSVALFLVCLVLKFFGYPECISNLLPALALNFAASTLVGLVFYEIANRYGNKIQAAAGVWASLLWFFAPAGGASGLFLPFNPIIVLVTLLPVYLHLRLALLEERQYYWWCWLGLLISLLIGGASSFIFSAGGIVLSAFFLPGKYTSSPVFAEPCLDKPKFNYTFLLLILAMMVASCFYLPWTNESLPFSIQIAPEPAGITLIVTLALSMCLFLLRLMLGKVFIGPVLFFLAWLLAGFIPVPQVLNHHAFNFGVLPLIPVVYLIASSCLPIFDVLTKKQCLIFTFLGSLTVGVFCCSIGIEFAHRLENLKQASAKQEILQSEISKTPGRVINLPANLTNHSNAESPLLRWNNKTSKLERINYSGLAHLSLTSNDFVVTLPEKQDISYLPGDNWAEVEQLQSKPWIEKNIHYLNLFAGPARRQKNITDNGSVQKGDLVVLLSSGKINPRQANNVRIKLAFPVRSSSGINWIWKGSNCDNLCSAPLKLEGADTLILNLINNEHWQMNDFIENFGISLSPGKRSLAIEKIDL